jgi:ribosome-associated translation inhibitor RaiA
MQVPLEIAFHNMEPSEFVEAKVRERVNTLERYSDRITRCSVSIEAPHRAHHQGNLYHVRIEISVPARNWW